MGDEPSRLEKIAAGVSSAVISAEYILCYNNYDGLHAGERTVRWLPIENSYFGDTPVIFTAIMASAFIGDKVEEVGKQYENKMLQFAGKHMPTLTAAGVGAYYSLGESIMPYLLPGTADVKDIPAVAITAVATPFIANYARKKWKTEWKDKAKEIISKTTSARAENPIN